MAEYIEREALLQDIEDSVRFVRTQAACMAYGRRAKMTEHGQYCPIMVAGGNMHVSRCIGKDCTWWLPYANDCALPVVAGILADSTICQNAFETESDENG